MIMAVKFSYHSETDLRNSKKIRELLKELPDFVRQFDVSMSNASKSTRTRVNYMYDYLLFFQYLGSEGILEGKNNVKDFTVSDLEKLKRTDIENYLQTFDFSRREKAETQNNAENLKARKLASLRSLYNYFCSNGDIAANPAAVTPMPKIHSHEVVALDADEVSRILHAVDTGEGLASERQVKLAARTRLRDKAILCTLLGTGIRISELVGLDLLDVDFNNASLQLIRKGGDYDEAYFGEDVEQALMDYIDNGREMLQPDCDALFISSSHGRLTDRAVENMVAKYVRAAGITKHVKVHTLRASYATELYRETNDVYMVKDALHHSSLNTSKHYVSGVEERKRKAAKAVKGLFS